MHAVTMSSSNAMSLTALGSSLRRLPFWGLTHFLLFETRVYRPLLSMSPPGRLISIRFPWMRYWKVPLNRNLWLVQLPKKTRRVLVDSRLKELFSPIFILDLPLGTICRIPCAWSLLRRCVWIALRQWQLARIWVFGCSSSIPAVLSRSQDLIQGRLLVWIVWSGGNVINSGCHGRKDGKIPIEQLTACVRPVSLHTCAVEMYSSWSRMSCCATKSTRTWKTWSMMSWIGRMMRRKFC